MRRSLAMLGLAVAIGMALAGCSFDTITYTIDRYGTVKARQVRLGCHDAYEVYDRPDAGQMLVLTNGLTEALAGCGGSGEMPRAGRLRRIADIFLEETTDRPACRVVRETPISEWQTEFGYQCGVPSPTRSRIGLRR